MVGLDAVCRGGLFRPRLSIPDDPFQWSALYHSRRLAAARECGYAGQDRRRALVTASAAGSAVAFDSPFRETPAISITAQDMATGDYYAITSPSAAGFTIRFFNAAGAGISRTFDYLAKGHGEQI